MIEKIWHPIWRLRFISLWMLLVLKYFTFSPSQDPFMTQLFSHLSSRQYLACSISLSLSWSTGFISLLVPKYNQFQTGAPGHIKVLQKVAFYEQTTVPSLMHSCSLTTKHWAYDFKNSNQNFFNIPRYPFEETRWRTRAKKRWKDCIRNMGIDGSWADDNWRKLGWKEEEWTGE